MKLTTYLKTIGVYFIPIILFALISFVYFSPVLDGKNLPQMDKTHTIGMAKELNDFAEKNPDEVALWTNSMFGGMPSYHIKIGPITNIFAKINRYIRFGMPYYTVGILFLYLLGFYILLLSLKIDKWLSFAGSIAFAFASYNLIIIIAGHITKAYAIGMMPPVVAGVILTFRKKYLAGGLLTLVALGCEIAANHVQITYYLALLLLVIGIVYFIDTIQEKSYSHFVKSAVILLIAAILAVLPNITGLLTTYEYSKESIRGKFILTNEKASVPKSGGLDKDYALAWSYGKKESLTLMIPNAVGGETGMIGNIQGALKKVSPNFQQAVAQQNQYWGEMPFTSGPVYVGAIICFLFVLGLFYIDGTVKWWILAASVLSLLLAWGKNLEWFTDLFFFHFPLYNKFRTVSMILVIAGLTMPLLAVLTLHKIIQKPDIVKKRKTGFFIAFSLTGGITLLFILFPEIFLNFISSQEAAYFNKQLLTQENQQYAQQIAVFLENLEKARISIFKADAIRSFSFIFAAAGLVWFFGMKKLKKPLFIGIITVLLFADMWVIAKRYLNNDDFTNSKVTETHFAPSQADKFILKFKESNKNAATTYRVFNISKNPFTEVNTSYFHHSLGGYHGAKLRRYQDAIDSLLVPAMRKLQTALHDTTRNVYQTLEKLPIVNMLNTQFVIYNPNENPIINMNALGNVWFVDDYKIVADNNEELKNISTFQPASTAIVHKEFEHMLSDFKKPQRDSSSRNLIALSKYKPNALSYQVNSKNDEIAVFSEIYYPKGWNAYIDGKKTDYFRANYLLRAMIIPAGKHLLEFKFEPRSYSIGSTLATSSSVLILLLILAFAAKAIREEMKNPSFVVEEITQKTKKEVPKMAMKTKEKTIKRKKSK